MGDKRTRLDVYVVSNEQNNVLTTQKIRIKIWVRKDGQKNMITKEEKKVVLEYVNSSYYDQDKLLKYLSMHDVVGNEVFAYCDKREYRKEQSTYSNWLDNEDGYTPLSVSDFVKRIPFYFYTKDVETISLDDMGSLHYLFSSSFEKIHNGERTLESIYVNLEYAFYHLHLPLNKIFSYWIDQYGNIAEDGFFRWCHYLHLCEEYECTDYFPDRFITAYNEMLEKAGLKPIIYEITETGLYEPFMRNGKIIEFEGRFPCDKNGNPIMKWIGVKATNTTSYICTCEKSKKGILQVKISPATVIHVLNFYNDSDTTNEWYQVYAGPLNMSFDHRVLKEKRKELKYSQEEVASAIETTVRTYQKWESGETTPNGHFLMRLMNWLDIPDVQSVIQYTDYKDN